MQRVKQHDRAVCDTRERYKPKEAGVSNGIFDGARRTNSHREIHAHHHLVVDRVVPEKSHVFYVRVLMRKTGARCTYGGQRHPPNKSKYTARGMPMRPAKVHRITAGRSARLACSSFISCLAFDKLFHAACFKQCFCNLSPSLQRRHEAPHSAGKAGTSGGGRVAYRRFMCVFLCCGE